MVPTRTRHPCPAPPLIFTSLACRSYRHASFESDDFDRWCNRTTCTRGADVLPCASLRYGAGSGSYSALSDCLKRWASCLYMYPLVFPPAKVMTRKHHSCPTPPSILRSRVPDFGGLALLVLCLPDFGGLAPLMLSSPDFGGLASLVLCLAHDGGLAPLVLCLAHDGCL